MDKDICCICRQEMNLDRMSKCSKCVGRFCVACLLTMVTNSLNNVNMDKLLCPYCQQDFTADCGDGVLVPLTSIKPSHVIRKSYPLIGEVEIDNLTNEIITIGVEPIHTLETIKNCVENGTVIWPKFQNFYEDYTIANSNQKFRIDTLEIHHSPFEDTIWFVLAHSEQLTTWWPNSKSYNKIRINQQIRFKCLINDSVVTHTSSIVNHSNRMLCLECNGPTTSNYEKHCSKSQCHKRWVKKQQEQSNSIANAELQGQETIAVS